MVSTNSNDTDINFEVEKSVNGMVRPNTEYAGLTENDGHENDGPSSMA